MTVTRAEQFDLTYRRLVSYYTDRLPKVLGSRLLIGSLDCSEAPARGGRTGEADEAGPIRRPHLAPAAGKGLERGMVRAHGVLFPER
jgi:hypothetical protein